MRYQSLNELATSIASNTAQDVFEVNENNVVYVNHGRRPVKLDALINDHLNSFQGGNAVISVSSHSGYGDGSVFEQTLSAISSLYSNAQLVHDIFCAIQPFLSTPTKQPLVNLLIDFKFSNSQIVGAEFILGSVNTSALTRIQPNSFTYEIIHSLVNMSKANSNFVCDYELSPQDYYFYLQNAASSYSTNTKKSYDKLKQDLLNHIGIGDEELNGIVKALSALLIIGNMGFQKTQTGIEIVSRKFHGFPEGLEHCGYLLELDSWEDLQNILHSATSVSEAESYRDTIAAEIYRLVVNYIIFKANEQLVSNSGSGETSSLLVVLSQVTCLENCWDALQINYSKDVLFSSAVARKGKSSAREKLERYFSDSNQMANLPDSVSVEHVWGEQVVYKIAKETQVVRLISEKLGAMLVNAQNLAITTCLNDSPMQAVQTFVRSLNKRLTTARTFFVHCINESVSAADSEGYYTSQLTREGISLIWANTSQTSFNLSAFISASVSPTTTTTESKIPRPILPSPELPPRPKKFEVNHLVLENFASPVSTPKPLPRIPYPQTPTTPPINISPPPSPSAPLLPSQPSTPATPASPATPVSSTSPAHTSSSPQSSGIRWSVLFEFNSSSGSSKPVISSEPNKDFGDIALVNVSQYNNDRDKSEIFLDLLSKLSNTPPDSMEMNDMKEYLYLASEVQSEANSRIFDLHADIKESKLSMEEMDLKIDTITSTLTNVQNLNSVIVRMLQPNERGHLSTYDDRSMVVREQESLFHMLEMGYLCVMLSKTEQANRLSYIVHETQKTCIRGIHNFVQNLHRGTKDVLTANCEWLAKRPTLRLLSNLVIAFATAPPDSSATNKLGKHAELLVMTLGIMYYIAKCDEALQHWSNRLLEIKKGSKNEYEHALHKLENMLIMILNLGASMRLSQDKEESKSGQEILLLGVGVTRGLTPILYRVYVQKDLGQPGVLTTMLKHLSKGWDDYVHDVGAYLVWLGLKKKYRKKVHNHLLTELSTLKLLIEVMIMGSGKRNRTSFEMPLFCLISLCQPFMSHKSGKTKAKIVAELQRFDDQRIVETFLQLVKKRSPHNITALFGLLSKRPVLHHEKKTKRDALLQNLNRNNSSISVASNSFTNSESNSNSDSDSSSGSEDM